MCDHTTIKTPSLFDALGLMDFGKPATNQAGFCEACGAHRVTRFDAGGIEYIELADGTWLNSLNKVSHSAEFINIHFGEYLWKF